MSKKQFSILIMPPGDGKSSTWQLPAWMVRTGLVLGIVLILFVGISFYLTTKLSVEMANYKTLKAKSIEQEKVLHQLSAQLQDLDNDIEDLIEMELDIRNLLNKPSRRKRKSVLEREKKKQLKSFKSAFKKAQEQSKNEQSPVPLASLVTEKITSLKGNIEKHYAKVEQYRDRFAATPSIWPVYGYIKSGFGWRRHPITGKRRLHKGIDIPSWRGAPVKSTADGVIEYAGWSGAFGNVVVVDHSYGYRTIYAHLSQMLVQKGDLVKKGQTIAQIGSTGLSTGPHLHYEVIRWRKSVQPKAYLELDMFTASTRIW